MNLYKKAFIQGGTLLSTNKIQRVFHSKDNIKKIKQTIEQNGDYTTRIFRNDELSKKITRSTNNNSTRIDIWDYELKAGKTIDIVNVDQNNFLKRVFNKVKQNQNDGFGFIEKYTRKISQAISYTKIIFIENTSFPIIRMDNKKRQTARNALLNIEFNENFKNPYTLQS